jgi:soluble methane monooxygenase-binding protein MmoD
MCTDGRERRVRGLHVARRRSLKRRGSEMDSVQVDDGSPDGKRLVRAVAAYTAYAIDLEYLWRWEIYQDADRLVQEGGSISLASATEAVDHVLAYFGARDAGAICGTGD